MHGSSSVSLQGKAFCGEEGRTPPFGTSRAHGSACVSDPPPVADSSEYRLVEKEGLPFLPSVGIKVKLGSQVSRHRPTSASVE